MLTHSRSLFVVTVHIKNPLKVTLMQDRAAYFTLRLSYNFTALHLISHKHSLHYGTHTHTHTLLVWLSVRYARVVQLPNCIFDTLLWLVIGCECQNYSFHLILQTMPVQLEGLNICNIYISCSSPQLIWTQIRYLDVFIFHSVFKRRNNTQISQLCNIGATVV